jgi:hypothetical protein
MSHTHEERLLNELLGDMASADASLDGAALEERLMTRWDARSTAVASQRTPSARSRAWMIGGIAAVITAVVLAMLRQPLPPPPPGGEKVADLKVGGHVGAPPAVLKVGTTPEEGALRAERASGARLAHQERPEPGREILSFVPLVPITDQELSGSFQIVRVQMPRVSLGALAPMLDSSGTNELVEADVLLGEDGMARAIRVSTNGTAYPWRSR